MRLVGDGVNVGAIAQGSSEFNISVIIDQEDLAKALNAVHDAFFSELKKTLNVFCLGTGNIGSTLFKQLNEQHQFLLEQNDLDIRVVGISNSKRMFFSREGIDLENWRNQLEQGSVADLAGFVSRMQELNLPNCVFIDNTASKLPSTYYERIFSPIFQRWLPARKLPTRAHTHNTNYCAILRETRGWTFFMRRTLGPVYL